MRLWCKMMRNTFSQKSRKKNTMTNIRAQYSYLLVDKEEVQDVQPTLQTQFKEKQNISIFQPLVDNDSISLLH